MGFNIYIFIIAVIIVGLYFYMNKNKEKKYEISIDNIRSGLLRTNHGVTRPFGMSWLHLP